MNRRTVHRWTIPPIPRGAGLGSALLLALLLAIGMLSLSGCKELEAALGRSITGSSHGVQVSVPGRLPVVGMVSDHKASAPGAMAWRRLFRRGALPAGGRLEWQPPLGAGNFQFPPGEEPLPGGPPFVWDDIPAGEGRTVYFRYSSGGDWGAVDTFSAFDASGHMVDRVMNVTQGLNPNPGATSTAGWIESSEDTLAGGEAPASAGELVDAWRVHRTFLPQNTGMTTARCQELVDWVQGDDVFFAMRLPISATTYLTEAHPVSIYLGDPLSNTLQLVRTVPSPLTPVITLPLTLQDKHLNFATLNLPAAPGEVWVTLGASGAPVDCPPGLDLATDTWAILSSLVLDLSHQPDKCANCVLPGYFCYAGQNPPLATSRAAFYQAEGITCLGPEIADLDDTSSWVMSGASTQIVTPTQVISLPHYFYVPSSLGTMAFSLSVTSTLDTGWGYYHGDWNGPDLESPLTQPFLASNLTYFWLVSAPIPTTTTPGPYSVVLSATAAMAPSDVRWASDLLWVGNWVAPPLPETWYRVYVPLVTK